MLAAALALTLAPASAEQDEAALTRHLRAIGDQTRFVPDKALAELLKLQAGIGHASAVNQAELLAQISEARMRLGDSKSALAVAEQIIDYGKRIGDNVVLGKGLLSKSYALFARAEVEQAHRVAFAAEKLAMSTDNAVLRAMATITAGQAHAERGDFPTALTKLQLAVDLSRAAALDDPVVPAAALNALTKLYVQMKQYDTADACLDELLAATEKLNSPGRTAIARNTEYGLAINAGQTERALRALLTSLALERQLGADVMLATTLVNLSDVYLRKRDYPRSVDYARQALRAALLSNDEAIAATARVNLGAAYLAMGRVAEGKQFYQEGMARYERENNKPDLQAVLHEYGEALERSGDLAGALTAYHRERALSNQLFEKQRQQAVMELQGKYETDKKQRQIELLSRENQLKDADLDNRRLQQRVWWLLALVFALAAMMIGLLYRKVRNANAQLEIKNLELKAQSTLDPLTMLYNRRHFQDFMRAMAEPGQPLVEQRQLPPQRDDVVGALFLLDVDHFKHINDNYGHAAGDAVLRMIAEKLRVALRETDMIVRWGGEEFLAYLPALPRDGLDEVARRILGGISAQPIRYQEHDIAVNVSLGFAPYPLVPGGAPLAWERAVNLIDMALYLAKSHGRNRAYGVRGFHHFERTSMEEIEQDLERAWRDGFVDLGVVLGGPAEAKVIELKPRLA